MSDQALVLLMPSRQHECQGPGAETLQAQKKTTLSDEERKQRKRLQNRLNQRARRTRIKDTEETKSEKRRPYKVTRWRVDEESRESRQGQRYRDATAMMDSSSSSTSSSSCRPYQNDFFDVEFDLDIESNCHIVALGLRQMRKQLMSPLADHLLTLIQYNVMRGTYQNKVVISSMVRSVLPETQEVVSLMTDQGFVASLVIQQAQPEMPSSLAPTSLQKTFAHATWIKLIPFPCLRDNLIRWEDTFSHQDFVGELIGSHIVGGHFFRPKLSPNNPPPAKSRLMIMKKGGKEIEEPANDERSGMMLWGEPHLASSWEVTPVFWKKWAWAMEGCDDLIRSSNHWRALRGDEPLCVCSEMSDAKGR